MNDSNDGGRICEGCFTFLHPFLCSPPFVRMQVRSTQRHQSHITHFSRGTNALYGWSKQQFLIITPQWSLPVFQNPIKHPPPPSLPSPPSHPTSIHFSHTFVNPPHSFTKRLQNIFFLKKNPNPIAFPNPHNQNAFLNHLRPRPRPRRQCLTPRRPPSHHRGRHDTSRGR